MKSEKPKTVILHNTPQFYVGYCKGWLARKRKEKTNPVEIAIVEDILKLVQITADQMEPKNSKENGTKQ